MISQPGEKKKTAEDLINVFKYLTGGDRSVRMMGQTLPMVVPSDTTREATCIEKYRKFCVKEITFLLFSGQTLE